MMAPMRTPVSVRSALRRLAAGLLLGAGLGLAGCTGMNMLSSDVTAYGNWPAERKPGTYVFERLPSQQARLDLQQQLEAAARPALAAVGFKPASDPKTAEFVVQLGMRSAPNERSRVDSLWAWQSVPPPYAYARSPGHPHPYPYPYYYPSPWVFPMDTPSYEREVVVMIRDPKLGQTLFESHAVSDGVTPSFNGLLGAMLEAALKDFPQSAGTGTHRVMAPLSR